MKREYNNQSRMTKIEREEYRASLDPHFKDQLDQYVRSATPVQEYVENWKAREGKDWAISAPPMIDQATLEEAQTGRQLTQEQYEKAQQERLTLELQSSGIAARLGRAGINVYQDSVSILGLYSENIEEKTQYKNTNFIPSVQSTNTHDMLKSVQYWLDTVKSSQRRMWVFSYGWVPLYEYREAHQKFVRWISKFHSESPLLEAAKVKFVYYSVEGTFQDENKKNLQLKKIGGVTHVNLHAHVLVKSERYLGSENWKILLDNIRARAPKGYLHDSPIKKAAEVVKYCFKPAEFDLLSNDQLAYFYTATKGLRFFTPVGELALFRRQMAESKVRLKHIETDKGPQWRFIAARERSKAEQDTDG